MLAYYINHPHEDKPDMSHWTKIQALAYQDTTESIEKLKHYVLEAQRIRVDLPLVRVYCPNTENETTTIRLTNEGPETHKLKKGDTILLQLVCMRLLCPFTPPVYLFRDIDFFAEEGTRRKIRIPQPGLH